MTRLITVGSPTVSYPDIDAPLQESLMSSFFPSQCFSESDGNGSTADKKIMLRCDFNNPAQALMFFPERTFDPPKSPCSSLRGGGVTANTLQLKTDTLGVLWISVFALYMFTLLFSSSSQSSLHCLIPPLSPSLVRPTSALSPALSSSGLFDY